MNISLIALTIAVGVIFLPQNVRQPKERVPKNDGAAIADKSHEASQNEQAAENEAMRGILLQMTQIQQKNSEILEDYENNQKQNATVNGNIQNYTLWLVIVSGIQTLVLGGTIYAVWAQTQANKASARSWIAVKRTGTLPDNWFELVVSKGYVPGLIAEFEVYGNTPIRITESRFIMRIVPARKQSGYPLEPDLPKKPDYGKLATTVIAGENRIVVPPEAPFQTQVFLRDNVLQEFENLALHKNS